MNGTVKAVRAKIKNTAREHNLFTDDMHIVLGLSGGPDSLCLFDVLCELAEEQKLKIYPVHVNHKFRPGAAEADQEYVEELCRQRGLQCESFVYDCNKIAETEGLTSEEAGRKVRYEAFVKTAEKVACENGVPAEKVVIAVAQNANDQAETILFRLLRGSGIDGLAGIAYKRYEKNFAVVRPLLDVSRDEIEKYCEERNLSPRIDHTNEEAIYARNKIRLELLPFLRENFNPNIIETVNRLGKNASCDKEFLYDEARRAYERARCGETTDKIDEVFTAYLCELHKAIRVRIYHMMLEEIGMRQNLTQGQIEAIEQICFSQSPSAACDLADGYKAVKMYDRLKFYRKQRSTDCEYRLSIMSAEEYESFRSLPKEAAARNVGSFAMPKDAAKQVCVRKRCDGDTIAIKIKNAEGEYEIKNKKLQDFFVDAKLPKMYRDDVDLLAYGGRILWILPSEHFPKGSLRDKGRFSASFQVNDENARDAETILVLEIL